MIYGFRYSRNPLFFIFFCSVCILIYLVMVKLQLDYWKEALIREWHFLEEVR